MESHLLRTLTLIIQFFHGCLKHLHVLNPRDQKFWHYSARFTCFFVLPQKPSENHWNTPRGLSCCVRRTTACHNRDALDSLVCCVRFFVTARTCLTCRSSQFCLVTCHLLCVLNLLCVFGNPSRSSSLVLQHSHNSRSSAFQLVLTFMSRWFLCAVVRVSSFRLCDLLLTP